MPGSLSDRGFALAAAVIVAASAVAMAAVNWGGFFYQDDFLFLRQGHDAAMSLSYLREGAFGHFFPGFRAAFWLQDRTVGLDHHVIVFVVAAVHVACLLAMLRLLILIFGRRPGTLVLLGMFGFSGLWLSGYLWWVSALQVMPATLLTIIVIDAHVRYLTWRRRRDIAVAALGLALALCFYEKPAQLVVLLPLLTLLAFSTAASFRGLLADLWGAWRLWAAFGVVLAVYAIAYLTGDFYVATVHPTAHTVISAVAQGWHQGFVPAFLGGPFTLVQHGSLGYPDPTRLLTVVDQLVVLGLVVLSVSRRRSAWRGWAFLATAFVINVAVIAWTRGGLLGAGVGRELKYLIDILPFAIVGIGLAFLPVARGPRAEAVPARSRPVPRPLVVLAATAFLTMFGVSAVRVARFWHGGDSARFGRTFDATREHLDTRQGTVYLDVDMPETVLSSAFQPYQRESVLLRLFGTRLRYAGQADRTLVVDPAGRVRPDAPLVQARLLPAKATIDGQPLPPDRGGAACLRSDDAPHLISIPLTAPLPPGRPYLRLRTRAPRPVRLRFPQQAGIEIGAIDPARRSVAQRLDGGPRPLYVPLESPGAGTVDLLIDPGNPICLEGGTVGVPATVG
ncbi:hypothetical protein NBH00_02350 [Paraconexibacter antarcticus]|uniref:Transmembrane protein n=1 Tax=Paraconexibacter antarcticus TaxID=2949664 RepID=A0ABY5DTZ3_9ACTN|nr:hypothetical protein [Paraconexibacter antarcticus]UTI65059.1 hypothetical protein NBH00_02350 [Paraconexibacter antarcticus]